jgi:shikimate kinase
MKIILLGYMGSGKSTIGRLLSERLATSFIDLDAEIEERVNLSVSQYFERFGELRFRKLEREVLLDVLGRSGSMVIATGGGTPCYGDALEQMKSHSDAVTIYLKASIATLTDRLIHQKDSRPLIQQLTSAELPEFIGKHLFERSYFYLQADHVVPIDAKDQQTISEDILRLL